MTWLSYSSVSTPALPTTKIWLPPRSKYEVPMKPCSTVPLLSVVLLGLQLTLSCGNESAGRAVVNAVAAVYIESRIANGPAVRCAV